MQILKLLTDCLCKFHATPRARSSHARADMHAAVAMPPPLPPPPPTLAIRDYPASTTDRSIHLGKFPAMPCARSSHARAHMHAPLWCRRRFARQHSSLKLPQLRQDHRGGGGGMVTNPDARAGWMPMDGGDLVVPVSSPLPPPLLSLYLSLSLAPLLRAVSPRRISLVCTIGQDRRGICELILHVFLCKFRCSR